MAQGRAGRAGLTGPSGESFPLHSDGCSWPSMHSSLPASTLKHPVQPPSRTYFLLFFQLHRRRRALALLLSRSFLSPCRQRRADGEPPPDEQPVKPECRLEAMGGGLQLAGAGQADWGGLIWQGEAILLELVEQIGEGLRWQGEEVECFSRKFAQVAAPGALVCA